MAVKRTHKLLEMPPKEKLSGKDIAILERWIHDGAQWPAAPVTVPEIAAKSEHIGDAWSDPRNPIVQLFGGQRLDLWSFKPMKRPDVPDVKKSGWAKNDLDRFVLARFERDALAPPATADPRTLARRLYFDLTGLPPTPEQVVQFEKSVTKVGADAAIRGARRRIARQPALRRAFRADCGSTSSATATAMASTGTSFARKPGGSATTSSARSTPTNRSTNSFASNLPATNCSTARRRRLPSRTA